MTDRVIVSEARELEGPFMTRSEQGIPVRSIANGSA